MPVEAQLMAGPIGPDTIQVPGDPQRLRRAADGLGDMCQQLEEIGDRLRHADADEGRRGRTVRALSRVAGRTGRILQSDADTLQHLADAVQREADLLADAHASLDDLRSTWRRAREELREAVRGEQSRRGDDGPGARHDRGHRDDEPVDVEALIAAVDGDVGDQHEAVISRLSGLHFSGGGPRRPHASAMVVDGEIDRAVSTYRRHVDRVLDELTETMRRVHRADEELADLLRREETAQIRAQRADDGATEDGDAVSAPQDIRAVAEQVQQSARQIDHAAGQLRDIRLAIREGRMLPDDERAGSSDGFQRSWTQHLDELREDLDHARRAGDDIASRLAELDHEGARSVRRSGREDD